MNKSVKYTATLRSFSIVALILLCQSCQTFSKSVTHLSNPNLKSVKPEYLGNPYKHGRFVGPYRSINSGSKSMWNYVKWKLNPNRERAPAVLTSDTPVVQYSQSTHMQENHLVWLGHATVLLHLNGKSILIDPILDAPRLFHGSRLGMVPVDADQLSIDFLLVTHAHRDHLDKETVVQLQGQPMKAFTPMKMGSLLRSWRPNIEVQEAGWYQTYETESDISFTLLPAFHWSRRGALDTNSILWGSYIITAGDTTVFVAGDTGYADHFKEIGNLFTDIDYAILPIGSYKPDHIHKNSHMTPEQALQAFHDLKATTMIPVHYGTFDLSDEPIEEPMQRLTQEIRRTALPVGAVNALAIGEAHYLDR